MTMVQEPQFGSNIRQAIACTKEDRVDDALRLLRYAIQNCQPLPDELERAGRLLQKWTANAVVTSGPQIKVLMLGNCTTSWLATILSAVAFGQGIQMRVVEGKYDDVIGELMSLSNSASPDIVILVPWTQRLLSGSGQRDAQARIDDELIFWRQAWSLITQNHASRIVQVGYDWIVPGANGNHLGGRKDGDVAVIRRLNEALRSGVPSGGFFVDLEQLSGGIGRSSFYDPRRYFWTKQPFSERGVVELAQLLFAGIRAVMYGPKKVLVLDLDNTLWGGVVGETGPLGISLGDSPDGDAFRSFQKHVKELSQRGVVLAVASKNNQEDALAPFEVNSEMVLKVGDFAHIEAHWEPKDVSIRRIAETLKLGLESFVFFDDNPAERELVRQSLPEVAVVDVPTDPAEYVRSLQAGFWFEAVELLDADTQRTLQYQQEQGRRELQQQFGSMEDYLRSLEMFAEIDPIDASNAQRVVQLLGKTNQFNLTTRRHSHEDIRRLLNLPGALGMALSLRDRFGEHGLISVIIAVPDASLGREVLRIDTWLMSCRVISRTVEEFFLNILIDRAQLAGWDLLHGEFIRTRKNELVADLFDRFGFERLSEEVDTVRYRLPLTCARPAISFVQMS